MPLYEYECESCALRFERIRKFSDPPLDACPSCGGGVRKLLSSPAIQFKGSGWYITDYARKSAGDSGGAAKEGKEGKDGKDATDTKETAKKDSSAASASDSSSSTTSAASSPASSTTKSD